MGRQLEPCGMERGGKMLEWEQLLKTGRNRGNPFSIHQGRNLGSPFRENRGNPSLICPEEKLGKPCGGSGGSPGPLFSHSSPSSNSPALFYRFFSQLDMATGHVNSILWDLTVHFLYGDNYAIAPNLRHLFYQQLRSKGENKSTYRVIPKKR